jgi:catechol 2,3-dioxygenase-like lactoylglutathione lyase family enzyme
LDIGKRHFVGARERPRDNRFVRVFVRQSGVRMGANPKMNFSHVSVCVSDMERSIRFYREALDFTLGHSVEAGAPFEVLTELPEMKLRASFLTRDGIMIELLYYDRPGVVGSAERRPMNQLGLTHLALSVATG